MVPYRSQSDHATHACGHTATMTTFVQRCKDMQDAGQLPQNVVFIFQPEKSWWPCKSINKLVPSIKYPIELYLVFMFNPIC